jgi:transcriptional regulator with XRE-family HTH domain
MEATSPTHRTIAAIQARMLERGITQKDLAAALRVSQPTVSRILNGKTDLRLDLTYKIADVLGVDAEDLVAGAAA